MTADKRDIDEKESKPMGKHLTSVDQSDRRVPYNLRQSGATPAENVNFHPYPKISILAFIHAGGVLAGDGV